MGELSVAPKMEKDVKDKSIMQICEQISLETSVSCFSCIVTGTKSVALSNLFSIWMLVKLVFNVDFFKSLVHVHCTYQRHV